MATWNSIYNTSVSAIQSQMNALGRIQEQISSGLRIIRASDSPAEASTVMSLNNRIAKYSTYSANLQSVSTDQNAASSALQEMSNLLTKSKQLLMQASSGTYNASNRTAIGDEIDSILDNAISLGNYELAGRYLFAGDKVTSEAYTTVIDSNGNITRVLYSGSNSDVQVNVGPGVTYSGVSVGTTVFSDNDRQEPEINGQTGARVGRGTSTLTGYAWLSVGSATAFDSGTNTLGISSDKTMTAVDTLSGTMTLSVVANGTGVSTLQLGSGDLVNFSGTSTTVQVYSGAGTNGQTVFIDVSQFDTTINGTYSLTLTRTLGLSIDEGESYTAIPTIPVSDDANSNVAVTDSVTGEILYVDARAVSANDLVAEVRVPGTYDVFDTLVHIRDLMRNKYDYPEEQQQVLLGDALDAMNDVMGVVTQNMTIKGGQIQAMALLSDRLTDTTLTMSEDASEIADADITNLATELAQTQTIYQMTLASTGKLLNLSLLDYIS